jgi:hypothetical protein
LPPNGASQIDYVIANDLRRNRRRKLVTSFLLHILKAVWHRRVTGFWPIWITITGMAAVGAAWVVGYAPTPTVRTEQKTPFTGVRPRAWSLSAIVPLLLLSLLLAGYVAQSFEWANFADGDNHFFTLGTLKGQDLGLRIWPAQGRFFPLGLQEFNLIRHFTGSVAGYYALPLAQLLIVCCLLLFLDDELSLTARAAFAAIILIFPGTVVNFTELVTPDRNVVFFLLWLLLFVELFEKTGATAWAVAAAISAQAMIYYKETAFLLLFGFAAGRIVSRCWRTDRPGWDLQRLRDKESRLDFCFIFLAMLFVPFYLAAMMPHPNMGYADMQRVSLAHAILYYIKLDLLAWWLVAAFLRRTYLILQRRIIPLPLWDGLALGGIVFFAAYVYLRLTSPYYLAPVDLIALLYVGRFVILSWQSMPAWNRVAVTALALVVLLQSFSFSAFILVERKNVIRAKAEMADVIVDRYRSGAGNVRRLFFPFANIYYVTEFAAYLSYRGVPIEDDAAQADGPPQVTLLTKGDIAKDGPCVDYMSFICHTAAQPQSGDLAIELPDDEESLADISPYRNEGVPLFSYQPHPRALQSLIPFAGFFRIVSVPFERKQLPDRWLHASVTLWK